MSARTPGLFALTRRRFATPRSAALVIVLLTAFAAFVLAAAPRALVGVVRAETAHQISSIPATARDLSGEAVGVPVSGPATDPAVTRGWDVGAAEVLGGVGQALADARAGFDPAVREITSPAVFAVYTDPFVVARLGLPPTAPVPRIQALAEPMMTSQLRLVEGQWPVANPGGSDLQIVLSADAAETMQWPVGETREGVALVGTVDPVDPDADRWLHLPPALAADVFDDGNQRPIATAVAWVSPDAWAQLADAGTRARVVAWYPVDGAAAMGADPEELLASLRGATSARVPLDAAGELRIRFSSEIVDVLSTALARTDSATAILLVAATGPVAVSIALIALAGALVIRRRRTDLALLSARGAPIARLRGLLLTEGLLLGVPAAALAAGAGILATPNDAGPAPTLVAIGVGVVPALALAFALRPALLASHGRADLDAPVRSRATGIAEAVVLLLAAIAVTLLVVRGIGGATDGVDPLVVAAPLLATVALALVVVRLHPLPIAAVLRAARRGRGIVGLVGAARNLRDPAAGTTAVLAMLVAVAIAVFSSVVLATVDRGAVVAAERSVGADIQLSGPVFGPDLIERIRGLDDVVAVAGLMRGDYLPVQGADGRDTAQTVVTEVGALAAVQQGMTAAMPDAVAAGADPLEFVGSTALAQTVGTGRATVADRPGDMVATVDRVLGLSVSARFAVVDARDYTALTGFGFYPRIAMIDVAPGADAAAVAAQIGDLVGQAHVVRLLDDSVAEIQASPAVTALRVVLLAALAVAVALSVVALLLVAGVSRDARSRLIALLRTMGLDRRRGRRLVAWEFAPLGVTALVGGVTLGAVLPLLVVTSIDLRPFTGGGGQPSLVVDPVLTGILIAVVVLALALAVVGGVASARTTSMATVLRTEED